jgi:hypothetical protein
MFCPYFCRYHQKRFILNGICQLLLLVYPHQIQFRRVPPGNSCSQEMIKTLMYNKNVILHKAAGALMQFSLSFQQEDRFETIKKRAKMNIRHVLI